MFAFVHHFQLTKTNSMQGEGGGRGFIFFFLQSYLYEILNVVILKKFVRESEEIHFDFYLNISLRKCMYQPLGFYITFSVVKTIYLWVYLIIQLSIDRCLPVCVCKYPL